MKPRSYTTAECDSRIEEFKEVIAGCDETIALIDQVLDLTYGCDDGMDARTSILRVQADAERALSAWVARRPVI